MNYILTEQMVEYRTETEKLLFSLPLAGSAFRKVYYDTNMGRPCSIFVPAEDFVVSYGASDLLTCERATHVMKKTENEIIRALSRIIMTQHHRFLKLSSALSWIILTPHHRFPKLSTRVRCCFLCPTYVHIITYS